MRVGDGKDTDDDCLATGQAQKPRKPAMPLGAGGDLVSITVPKATPRAGGGQVPPPFSAEG